MTDKIETTPAPRRTAESMRAWKIFLVPALLALVGYVVLYGWDARMRTQRGPWEVTFLQETDGTPAVVLAQPSLQLRDIKVRFVGEQFGTNSPALPQRVRFDQPAAMLPFGKTAFDDLMYLPGTVVLHCFGHEVQMLPRTLYLNRKGHEWRNGAVYELNASGKLPTLEPPSKMRQLRDSTRTPP